MSLYNSDIEMNGEWMDVTGDYSGKSVLIQNKSSDRMIVFVGETAMQANQRDGVSLRSSERDRFYVSDNLFIFGDGPAHISEVDQFTNTSSSLSGIPTDAGVQLAAGDGSVTGVSAARSSQSAWLENGAGDLLWAIDPGANDTFQGFPIEFVDGLVLKCAALATHTEEIAVTVV